jgi:hypothetical protein
MDLNPEMLIVADKHCGKCVTRKPLEDFANTRNTRDGKATWCRACMSDYCRAYRLRRIREQGPSAFPKLSYTEYQERHGREKVLAQKRKHYASHTATWRDYARFKKYGITAEQFADVLQSQGNRCPICERDFSETRKPHVDHDHRTGLVRGLLCNACNVAIGHFDDDTSRMRRAEAYLNAQAERLTESARDYDAGCDSPNWREQ